MSWRLATGRCADATGRPKGVDKTKRQTSSGLLILLLFFVTIRLGDPRGKVRGDCAIRSATNRNYPRQTASTGGHPYPENRLASEPLLVRQCVVGEAADLHVVPERIVHVEAVEPAIPHVL